MKYTVRLTLDHDFEIETDEGEESAIEQALVLLEQNMGDFIGVQVIEDE